MTRSKRPRGYIRPASSAAALFLLVSAVLLPQKTLALDSSSAHFRNTRSDIDSGGGAGNSASFVSVNAAGDISLTTHTSTSYQVRSGLIPIYFYPGQMTFSAAPGPAPGTISLQFTAPGNDAQQAGTRASHYLLRVSSVAAASPALSELLFAAASSVTAPSPGAQGTVQNLQVNNLAAGNSYYFAIRGQEADLLPGVLQSATAYADIVAPGVFSITFTGISTNSFTLYWTSGTVASGYNPVGTQYAARVSTSSTFNGALISTTTTNLSSLLAGLDPNTTYYAQAAAFGNAVTTTFTNLGSTPTLANQVLGAEVVCRTSLSSATARWLAFPGTPSSASAEGYSFEISTASDFSGTIFSSVTMNVALSTLTVGGLTGGTSYFFRIGSLNWDLVPDYVTINGAGNIPNITGFGGRTGFKIAVLSWDALPSTGSCSIIGFNLYRSTYSPPTFSLLAATTATVDIDTAVVAGSTFYYELTGRLQNGFETFPTSTTLVFVRSAPPLPPFGVQITSVTASDISLSWKPVPAYVNGYRFASYAAPAQDELLQYHIYRATAPLNAPWASVAYVSSKTWSWTDLASGPQFYYRILAENSSDASANSLIVSQGNRIGYAVAPDNASTFQLNSTLLTSIAGVGTDPSTAFLVQLSSSSADIGPNVLKSIDIEPYQGGTQFSPNYQLPGLGHLQLHYDQQNGKAIASAAGLPPQPASPESLSVFWYNGSNWLQLYGKLDAANQVMNVDIQNFGKYQLRAVTRPADLTVDSSGLTNKFITPNGDGKNDNAVIVFANNSCSQVTGKIYDLKGALVSSMAPGPIEQSPGCSGSMMWDGKSGGAPVPGGVYIYQIQGEGKTFTGTLVVIR